MNKYLRYAVGIQTFWIAVGLIMLVNSLDINILEALKIIIVSIGLFFSSFWLFDVKN